MHKISSFCTSNQDKKDSTTVSAFTKKVKLAEDLLNASKLQAIAQNTRVWGLDDTERPSYKDITAWQNRSIGTAPFIGQGLRQKENLYSRFAPENLWNI